MYSCLLSQIESLGKKEWPFQQMRRENGTFVCKDWTWTQTLHFTWKLTQKDRRRKVEGKAEAPGICVALALGMCFQMGCWEQSNEKH